MTFERTVRAAVLTCECGLRRLPLDSPSSTTQTTEREYALFVKTCELGDKVSHEQKHYVR